MQDFGCASHSFLISYWLIDIVGACWSSQPHPETSQRGSTERSPDKRQAFLEIRPSGKAVTGKQRLRMKCLRIDWLQTTGAVFKRTVYVHVSYLQLQIVSLVEQMWPQPQLSHPAMTGKSRQCWEETARTTGQNFWGYRQFDMYRLFESRGSLLHLAASCWGFISCTVHWFSHPDHPHVHPSKCIILPQPIQTLHFNTIGTSHMIHMVICMQCLVLHWAILFEATRRTSSHRSWISSHHCHFYPSQRERWSLLVAIIQAFG